MRDEQSISMAKIFQNIKKLRMEEKLLLIFELLKEKEISFVEVNKLYVRYLEYLDSLNEKSKNQFAFCLSTKYQKITDDGWLNARSSILLHPYVPDDFIEKYVLKNTTKEEIEKEKKYLERELGVKMKEEQL